MLKPRFVLIFIYLVLTALVQGEATQFNAERAFKLLERICSFGPRVPGTSAHQQCLAFIKTELMNLGYTVYIQEFEAQPELIGKKVRLYNILAYSDPLSTGTIVQISSHWDTRAIAERDPNPSLRNKPIIGANDGASGNAIMLELARVIKLKGGANRVILAFFDGEDQGINQKPDTFCLGSRYLAENYPAFLRFDIGINLDMVADEDLLIKIEPYSYSAARQLVEEFWDIAQAEYPAHFSREFSPPIYDDHYPFISQGKPYINIIDFDYRWWHTQNDTVENCSPHSLQIIGNTLVRFLYLKQKIDKNSS